MEPSPARACRSRHGDPQADATARRTTSGGDAGSSARASRARSASFIPPSLRICPASASSRGASRVVAIHRLRRAYRDTCASSVRASSGSAWCRSSSTTHRSAASARSIASAPAVSGELTASDQSKLGILAALTSARTAASATGSRASAPRSDTNTVAASRSGNRPCSTNIVSALLPTPPSPATSVAGARTIASRSQRISGARPTKSAGGFGSRVASGSSAETAAALEVLDPMPPQGRSSRARQQPSRPSSRPG